jgi:hypothetical protein
VPPGCLSAPAINASLVYLQFDPSITRWFIVCQVLSWCKYFIDRRADRFTRRNTSTSILTPRSRRSWMCSKETERDVPRTTITVALQCRRSKRHLEDVYRMSIFSSTTQYSRWSCTKKITHEPQVDLAIGPYDHS